MKKMEEKKNEEFLRVRKIEDGIVIDHVPRGQGLRVLSVLGVNESFNGTISMLINAPSSAYGLKDVIKIEGKELSKKEIEKIALIAPYASINVVKGYEVVEKYRISLPDVLEGAVKCPNPNCITNREGTPKMRVRERSPLKLQCAYCEKVYGEKDLAV